MTRLQSLNFAEVGRAKGRKLMLWAQGRKSPKPWSDALLDPADGKLLFVLTVNGFLPLRDASYDRTLTTMLELL